MSEHPFVVSNDPSQVTGGSPARSSRRGFLRSMAVAASAPALSYESAGACIDASASARPAALAPARPVPFNINGKSYALSLEPRVALLDLLCEVFGLTGAKKGCDRGQRGACTVLVNGRRISSCLTLAIIHESGAITIVEGLAHAYEDVADHTALYPVQVAFLEHDASQCSCYTPGQVCSAVVVLEEAGHGMPSAVTLSVAFGSDGAVALTKDEVRERMSDNLCHCGAYLNIVAATRTVAAKSDNVA